MVETVCVWGNYASPARGGAPQGRRGWNRSDEKNPSDLASLGHLSKTLTPHPNEVDVV